MFTIIYELIIVWGHEELTILEYLNDSKDLKNKDTAVLSIRNSYPLDVDCFREEWGLEKHKIYINFASLTDWLAFKNEKYVSSPTQVKKIDQLSCGLGN